MKRKLNIDDEAKKRKKNALPLKELCDDTIIHILRYFTVNDIIDIVLTNKKCFEPHRKHIEVIGINMLKKVAILYQKEDFLTLMKNFDSFNFIFATSNLIDHLIKIISNAFVFINEKFIQNVNFNKEYMNRFVIAIFSKYLTHDTFNKTDLYERNYYNHKSVALTISKFKCDKAPYVYTNGEDQIHIKSMNQDQLKMLQNHYFCDLNQYGYKNIAPCGLKYIKHLANNAFIYDRTIEQYDVDLTNISIDCKNLKDKIKKLNEWISLIMFLTPKLKYMSIITEYQIHVPENRNLVRLYIFDDWYDDTIPSIYIEKMKLRELEINANVDLLILDSGLVVQQLFIETDWSIKHVIIKDNVTIGNIIYKKVGKIKKMTYGKNVNIKINGTDPRECKKE